MHIYVKPREGDVHACINGDERRWACGPSVDAAIGNLMRTHASELGFTFHANGPKFGADPMGPGALTAFADNLERDIRTFEDDGRIGECRERCHALLAASRALLSNGNPAQEDMDAARMMLSRLERILIDRSLAPPSPGFR